MDRDLLTKYGKQLLAVLVLLIAVALLVGGEDNPGMIAQIGETTGNNRVPEPVPAPPAAPVETSAPGPASAKRQADPLDDWYAPRDPSEAVGPTPVDESHLINDTKPLVSTEPLIR